MHRPAERTGVLNQALCAGLPERRDQVERRRVDGQGEGGCRLAGPFEFVAR
jgi:hypothetical protein